MGLPGVLRNQLIQSQLVAGRHVVEFWTRRFSEEPWPSTEGAGIMGSCEPIVTGPTKDCPNFLDCTTSYAKTKIRSTACSTGAGASLVAAKRDACSMT